MVTYSELFLLLTLIVSIVALVVNITKKKKTAIPNQADDLFLKLMRANRLSVAFLLLL